MSRFKTWNRAVIPQQLFYQAAYSAHIFIIHKFLFSIKILQILLSKVFPTLGPDNSEIYFQCYMNTNILTGKNLVLVKFFNEKMSSS